MVLRNIEKKWQERWEKEARYQAEDFSKKPKQYILVEFPKCGKLASCSQKLTYNNHFVPVKDWDTRGKSFCRCHPNKSAPPRMSSCAAIPKSGPSS